MKPPIRKTKNKTGKISKILRDYREEKKKHKQLKVCSYFMFSLICRL
jgi:hypothetical protein